MGFVEGVLCEIHHCSVYLIRDLLGNAVCNTARHSFFRISMYKVLALLLHHISLFLTHGAAHKVASSHRITAKLAHNLHNLLLIHDTAIGRRKNRLQLRTWIRNRIMIVFSLDVCRYKVHRTRSV